MKPAFLIEIKNKDIMNDWEMIWIYRERRSAITTYKANAIATGRAPIRMTTGVARIETNDYEGLMTARTPRDSASSRRASGCSSDLRSLTVRMLLECGRRGRPSECA
jgi:hypothetical protein